MNKNIQYKKLTDICEIITGEWGTEITENSQNIVSVIRTTNFLNNGKIDIQNKELIKREIDKKKIEQKQLKRGDIIIEKSGGSPNQPVGRVVFFDLNINEVFLCNNFTSILRVKEDINSKYIFYFLRNNYKKNKVVKYQNKTTGIINLKLQNYLNESCIFLPELKIQNKIVNILDNLENIIEKNQNYLTHLGVLTKSLFTIMFGDIKTNDKNWEIKKLGEVIQTQYGTSKKATSIVTGFPILRMNNITYSGEMDYRDLKYIELSDNEKEKFLLKKGELLFNRTNSKELVGKTGLFELDTPMAFAGYLIRMNPSNLIHSKFLLFFMNSEFMKKLLYNKAKNIVGMANINAKELEDFSIILPPIELQNKFAERIEKIEKLKFIIMTIILNTYETMKKKGVKKD